MPPYVVLDRLALNIADAPKDLSDAPEMSLRIAESEVRKRLEEQIRCRAFQKLQCSRYAHGRWDIDLCMHVIIIDHKLAYSYAVPFCGLANKELA